MHLLHVNRQSAHTLLQLQKKTSTRHVRDYQILCDDMLTHVAIKIQHQADIDGTYLSGRTTNKRSHGREMGDLDRYAEKTLIDIQQRDSQRYSVLVTNAHENCEAVDQLVSFLHRLEYVPSSVMKNTV